MHAPLSARSRQLALKEIPLYLTFIARIAETGYLSTGASDRTGKTIKPTYSDLRLRLLKLMGYDQNTSFAYHAVCTFYLRR